jgi:hypothetical protein
LDKGGDGQIGLARSGGEVENPQRVVGRKKKKKKIIVSKRIGTWWILCTCIFISLIDRADNWQQNEGSSIRRNTKKL